jgi:cobalamin biosynthetic protein CobC
MATPGDRDLPRHGGDLAFANARYGEPPDGWLDLSTGINPVPYPGPLPLESDLARLPSPDALDRLLVTARSAYAVPDDDDAIIATPGTEIAIRLLPLVAPPGTVAIVSPTYGSHGEAWTGTERAVIAVSAIDFVPADAKIVVLANPNNPDGRIADVHRLISLAERKSQSGGLLIVDEAFADLVPSASLVPHLSGLPAVVLRSFGKFYGMAGLRLGFIAGPADAVVRIRRLLGDWPVSGPAIRVGALALADRGWRNDTIRRLAKDAARLRAVLASNGLTVVGGTDLFVLVESLAAGAIHRGLAEQGIWTRAFPEHRRWLRIGLPGDDAGFARLEHALASLRTPAAVR